MDSDSAQFARPKDPSPWSPFRRHLTAVILIVGVIAFVGFLGMAGETALLGFLLAFLVFRPIRWLSGRLRFRGAVALMHLGLFALLILIISGALGYLATSVDDLLQSLQTHLGTSDMRIIAERVQPSGALEGFSQAVASLVGSIARLVGVAFLAIIVSFWLLNDLKSGEGVLRGLFREAGLHQMKILLSRLDRVWLGYLTAQVIFGLVMTVASLIQFGLMGVPYFILMAVLTGLLTLIPSIGGLVSSIVVAIPCLVLGSTRFPDMDPIVFALLVWGISILITQVSYNFLAVPIVGKYVRLPAVIVLLAVLVAVGTGSFVFAFLVVPMLSSLKIIGAFGLAKATGVDPYPEASPTAEP